MPIAAAYASDRSNPSLCTNRKYSPGAVVLRKPRETHHGKGIGSLIGDNSVPQ